MRQEDQISSFAFTLQSIGSGIDALNLNPLINCPINNSCIVKKHKIKLQAIKEIFKASNASSPLLTMSRWSYGAPSIEFRIFPTIMEDQQCYDPTPRLDSGGGGEEIVVGGVVTGRRLKGGQRPMRRRMTRVLFLRRYRMVSVVRSATIFKIRTHLIFFPYFCHPLFFVPQKRNHKCTKVFHVICFLYFCQQNLNNFMHTNHY